MLEQHDGLGVGDQPGSGLDEHADRVIIDVDRVSALPRDTTVIRLVNACCHGVIIA